MEINPAAPARAERDVEIAAPIEIVWDVLSNVQNWPRWNDEVDSTAMTGPTAPGTEFRWKPGRGTIKSRIESADRPHHLAWTGHTFGISAIHVWWLEREEGNPREDRGIDGRSACTAPARDDAEKPRQVFGRVASQPQSGMRAPFLDAARSGLS